MDQEKKQSSNSETENAKETSSDNKKVNWVYNESGNFIYVEDKNSDLAEFVFALTRYKNEETHEESLKIESYLRHGEDFSDLEENGEIHTYIYSLDNDIKGLMRYGVAFSDIVYIKLCQKIKDVYLKLPKTNPDEEDDSTNRLDNFLSYLGSYFSNDDNSKDENKDFLYIPVNDFNDLALECNYKKIEQVSLRKELSKKGYIRTLNGRNATLVKIKGKPIRVLAFLRGKIQDYITQAEPKTSEGSNAESYTKV